MISKLTGGLFFSLSKTQRRGQTAENRKGCSDGSFQPFPTASTVLTIEARGMSKVTKTILILRLDSWIAAHSGTSCCALSTSSLLLSPSTSTGGGQGGRKNTHASTPPWTPAIWRCKEPRAPKKKEKTTPLALPHRGAGVELRSFLKRPVPADGVRVCDVWLSRPAVPDRQLLFEAGRVSVPSCWPNSRWLHFTRTPAPKS